MDFAFWESKYADKIEIYTDGSYNGTAAAWAFAIAIHEGSDLVLLGYWHGAIAQEQLRTLSGDGAAMNAHTAELHALVWATWWATRWIQHEGWNGDLCFCWDATTAGQKATGLFSSNDRTGHLLRCLQQTLDSQLDRPIQHTHVKANSGSPLNELVDSAAKLATRSQEHQTPPGAQQLYHLCAKWADGGRISLLRGEAHSSGIHLLGLQEARTQAGMTISQTHIRLASGATTAGQAGVELWIARKMPIAQDPDSNTNYFIKPSDCTVSYSDPRIMMVHIVTKPLAFFVCVAHAPHSLDPKCEEWWNTFYELLEEHVDLANTVFLIDANARIAEAAEPHFGGVLDTKQNKATPFLCRLMEQADLFAPATFDAYHWGPIHTWVHPSGKFKARLDYVMLPLHWKGGQIMSWVNPNIHAGHPTEDHLCVSLRVQWMTAAEIAQKKNRKIKREAFLLPDADAKLQDILKRIPEVNWEVNASQHAAEVIDFCQQQLVKAFTEATSFRAAGFAKPSLLFMISPIQRGLSENTGRSWPECF